MIDLIIACPEMADVLLPWADLTVRHHVARGPSTPADVLLQLSEDEDEYVRCCVAKNTNTPAEVLLLLSGDEDIGVRCWVAENPSVPAEVLLLLSKDKGEDVRWCVAARSATNPSTEAMITSQGALI